MKFRIALAQMRIANDSRINLKKMASFVDRARKRDADLVVFPETAVSGLSLKERDLDANNRFRDIFAKMAIENSIDMIPGSAVVPKNGKLYNTSYYIDRKGRELTRYHKMNLWVAERKVIEPGKDHAVAKTRFGKIGLVICWDMVRPDIFHSLVGDGAQTIVCSSYWWYAPGKNALASPENIKSLVMARSFENLVVMAYCNAAGSDKMGRRLLGRSQIVQPFVQNKTVLDHNSEGLLVGDVDLDRIRRLERDLLIRRAIMS